MLWQEEEGECSRQENTLRYHGDEAGLWRGPEGLACRIPFPWSFLPPSENLLDSTAQNSRASPAQQLSSFLLLSPGSPYCDTSQTPDGD